MSGRRSDRLIRASGSPRRRELLSNLGIDFTVDASSAEEEGAPRDGERPEGFALRLAVAKAAAVARGHPGAAVLGADTVVVLDGEVLGKPRNAEAAVATLKRLRGRVHRVITAVAFFRREAPTPVTDSAATLVRFRGYTDEEIDAYVASGDPMDKAGAYGIQSEMLRPATDVEGCVLSVVGLPACLVAGILEQDGWRISALPGFSVPEPCGKRPGGCSLPASAS